MPDPLPRTRDDASLNTGLSSAATRKREERQKELHDRKQRQQESTRVKLTRDGSAIQDWLDEEIKDVGNLEKMVTEFDPQNMFKTIPLAERMNVTNAELLQAQTLARMMHIEWLKSAKKRVDKYMKEPKPVKDKDADGFGGDK